MLGERFDIGSRDPTALKSATQKLLGRILTVTHAESIGAESIVVNGNNAQYATAYIACQSVEINVIHVAPMLHGAAGTR
jgi:hypothetical protein